MESNYENQVSCEGLKSDLTSVAWRLAQNPRSSVTGGETSELLNSTFQASSCFVSKSRDRVWCWAGSNSHKLKARR